MKLPSLAIGAVALTTVLAGCSVFPEPSVSPMVTSTTPEAASVLPDSAATSEQPPATASAETGSTGFSDGYLDMGYGIGLPADGPGDCAGPADIFIGTRDGKTISEILRPQNLVDMGPREFAEGEVGYDEQGRVATYTVAAGDVEGVIGERLCIYSGGLIGMLNGKKGYESIQPGEVLVINPDAVPGFEYQDPYG